MATDQTEYVEYEEAVAIHVGLMRRLDEERAGVFSRHLVESALARPRHTAVYENADVVKQAAALLFGLVKNHPWIGGDKRTATTIFRRFLEINEIRSNWTIREQIELVLAVEADEWKVDEIDAWLRSRINPSISK